MRFVILLPLVILLGCSAAPSPSGQPTTEVATNATSEKPKTKIDLDELAPITFTDLDLFDALEPGGTYEPWMLTDRVRELDGRRVRITGFMFRGGFQLKNIKEFVMLREEECPYGPEGQGHHAIAIELQGDLRTSFTTGAVTVEGKLILDPFNGPDGKTYSLYRLYGTRISRE